MDFMIRVSVYYKPLIPFCVHVRFSSPFHSLVAGQGGAATHKHMRNQPCRPDRTRQIAGHAGRNRNTQTHAEPTLPARPHSADRRPGRSRNTQTHACGTNPAGKIALGRSPVSEEPQHICMRPILLMQPHSKCVYSTRSPLWMQSLSKHYKMPQVYPEVIEWSDKERMVRETKQ